MERTKLESTACNAAGKLGTFCGWWSYQWPKVRRFTLRIAIWLLLSLAAALVYVEVGHNKGWKRADAWYECLHNHHHFFWQ